MRKFKYSIPVIVLFIFFAMLMGSNNAHACPVCYGETNSKMAEGVNAAVLLLLGITGGVMGLFSLLFVHIRKRMKITLNGAVDYPSLN